MLYSAEHKRFSYVIQWEDEKACRKELEAALEAATAKIKHLQAENGALRDTIQALRSDVSSSLDEQSSLSSQYQDALAAMTAELRKAREAWDSERENILASADQTLLATIADCNRKVS